ncbi:MAG: hypothetical protein JWP27_505 [Flaviaesturariibacter sp.]|nr:hypothetical protein [Flaviaesturariibacter sp.]
MCNAGIILTKNRILAGVRRMLEGIEEELVRRAYFREEDSLRPALEPPPKISKGENYGGLPYLVLDYPRQFDSLNILAVRTMFWWGHEFSSTLHLAGRYKEDMQPSIEASYALLARKGYFIGVSEDPWQHHFDEENYLPVSSFDAGEFSERCRQFDHLKIAARWTLRDANFIAEDLVESWETLMGIMNIQ